MFRYHKRGKQAQLLSLRPTHPFPKESRSALPRMSCAGSVPLHSQVINTRDSAMRTGARLKHFAL